jgi:hypothetical protein
MIIIIGSGISGLYLGYLLKRQKKDFIILEKDSRYGGRVFVEDFEDKKVNLGAGIGRFNKDKTLYNLCQTLNVNTNKFKVDISYSFPIKKPLLYYVEELKEILQNKRYHRSFFNFLEENLEKPYDFIKISGYTDYINADVKDTLYNYGFEDNVSGWEGFSIDWQMLLDRLYEILKDHIYLDEKVIKIDRDQSVIFTTSNQYKYETIVCSIPPSLSRFLFPDIKILNEIDCQSFSRIYAKITKGKDELANKIKNYTVVDSFLQKIIPIDQKNGIYMIGYNDNYNADISFKYFTTLDEEEVYKIIESEIYKSFHVHIKIEVAKIAYWNEGTSYFLPLSLTYKNRDEWLSYARNPVKDIFFIGEGFSHNQGWVQGSLESVDSIIYDLI